MSTSVASKLGLRLCVFPIVYLVCISLSYGQVLGKLHNVLSDPTFNSFISNGSEGVYIANLYEIKLFTGEHHIGIFTIQDKLPKGSIIQSKVFEAKDNIIIFSTYDKIIYYDRKSDETVVRQFRNDDQIFDSEYNIISLNQKDELLHLAENYVLLTREASKNQEAQILASTRSKRFVQRNAEDSRHTELIGFRWYNDSGIDYYEFDENYSLINRKSLIDSFYHHEKYMFPKFSGGVLVNDQLWAVSDIGLFSVDLSSDHLAQYYPNKLHSFFKDIVTYNGELIISTKENGLLRFSLNTRSFLSKKHNDILNKCLSDDNLGELSLIDDHLWITQLKEGSIQIDLSRLNYTHPFVSTSKIKSINNHQILYLKDHEIFLSDRKNTKRLIAKGDQVRLFDYLNDLIIYNDRGTIIVVDIFNKTKKHQLVDFSSEGLNDLKFINEHSFALATTNRFEVHSLTNNQEKLNYSQNIDGEVIRINQIDSILYLSINGNQIASLNNEKVVSYDVSSELINIESKGTHDRYFSTSSGLYKDFLSNSGLVSEVSNIVAPPIIGSYIIDSIITIVNPTACFAFQTDWQLIGVQYFDQNFPLIPENLDFDRSQNILYINSGNQLITIDSSYWKTNNNKLNIKLVEVLVNNEEFLFDENHILSNGLTLPYRDNSLTLKFEHFSNFINKFPPSSYELLFGDNVTEYGTILNQPIDFQNLKWGSYKLKIENPVHSFQLIEIDITIKRPFYLQYWFICISTLCLLGIGFASNYLLIRKRIMNLQIKLDKQNALSKQREKIADDLHDELGTELSKIIYLTDEAILSNNQTEQNQIIQSISKSAVDSIQNMRDILWVLDDRHTSLENLWSRIKVNTNKVMPLVSIICEFEQNFSNPNLKINANTKKDILRIAKEATQNIIKHSQSKKVTYSINQLEDNLTIIFRDYGKGIAKDRKNGYGLNSMKKRVDALNGKLSIQSSQDGVLIIIKLNLADTSENG